MNRSEDEESDDNNQRVRSPRAKVTASAAGTVLGLSKYARPHDLWRVKTEVSERDNSVSDAAAHGISLEPIVKQLYESIHEIKVEPAPFRNHHEEEWREKMGAEPDGISKDIQSGEHRLLEIKCPAYYQSWNVIPVDYLAQIQFQMDVWNVASCDFVSYFHLTSTIKIWRVYKSPPYIKWMREKLDHFIESVDNFIPIDENVIPFIHYDATELAEKDYKYHNVQTKFTRKQLPPKVHCPVILDRSLSEEEKKFIAIKLTPPAPARWLPRWITRTLVYVAYFLIFVLIFLSFIPVVRIEEASDS